MKPEEKARQQIDLLLQQCGWLVQDYRQVNLSAGSGIAIREVPMKEGKADYLLCVDRKAVGIIEAKKVGTLLSGVAEQSAQYAESLPDWMEVGRIRSLAICLRVDRRGNVLYRLSRSRSTGTQCLCVSST